MSGNERESENNGTTQDDGLRVTDRRLFTANGILRNALPEEEAPAEQDAADQPGTDAATPSASVADAGADAGFERRPLDEPEGVDFTMLINAMAQPALIFLGEIPHPGTGQPEVNLEQARLQIDLLDTLRIKSRGNLTADEEGLLDRMLYQLRMLYVARSGKSSP